MNCRSVCVDGSALRLDPCDGIGAGDSPIIYWPKVPGLDGLVVVFHGRR